ncbi:hypothetical protein AB3S75_039784 [Citrus x aurantiifolia]
MLWLLKIRQLCNWPNKERTRYRARG